MCPNSAHCWQVVLEGSILIGRFLLKEVAEVVCIKHEVVPAPCVLGMLFQDIDSWKGYFGGETVTECGSIGVGGASSPGNQLIVGKLVRKLSRVGAHLLLMYFIF